jgi:hypothetical protein
LLLILALVGEVVVTVAVTVVVAVEVNAVVAQVADVVVGAVTSVEVVEASVEVTAVVEVMASVAVAATARLLLAGDTEAMMVTVVPVQVPHHLSMRHMLMPSIPNARDIATEDIKSPW